MPEPKKFIALALTEDQCRAVMAACTAGTMQIADNHKTYDRLLQHSGKTADELQALYGSVVIYVGEKLEES
jgi:hypothetical protein